MKRKLSNVNEGMHVRGRRINGIQLHYAVGHEVDGTVVVGVSKLAVAHICEIEALKRQKKRLLVRDSLEGVKVVGSHLETCVNERVWNTKSEFVDVEEC